MNSHEGYFSLVYTTMILTLAQLKWLFPGVNLIKLLQVLFTSLAIVIGSENNSYTCKVLLKWPLETRLLTILNRYYQINGLLPTFSKINMVSTSWLWRINWGGWSQSETAKYFEGIIRCISWGLGAGSGLNPGKLMTRILWFVPHENLQVHRPTWSSDSSSSTSSSSSSLSSWSTLVEWP